MILGRVDGIHADNICTQLLQERYILRTSCYIGQGIGEQAIRRCGSIPVDILLIGDATDEELSAVFIEEMRSLYGFELLDF